MLDRRGFLRRASAALTTLLLGGCDRLSASPTVQNLLSNAEDVNRWLQRQLIGGHAMAREYSDADLSPQFRANGSTDPDDPTYRRFAAKGFVDWRLEVDGLVDRPARLSLAELRQWPARTQITRHDCVEGWSCIGKWTGVKLADVLRHVGLRPGARYVVFHCADSLEGSPDRYYESIDMVDAAHPQTILAYAMNDQPLPIAHGAPLRLRVERQLGYKMAKYIMRIEVVDDLSQIGGGRGGYWEDRGYEWYAGI
ncbi:MAG TPA: molybdopterin-binding protein [Patescibacteria group bacterium]|nr:molybdopterin-binding protein [Patescibacteria group bacterium]